MTLERLQEVKRIIEAEIKKCDVSEEEMNIIENLVKEYRDSLINSKRQEKAVHKDALNSQLALIDQLIEEEI